MKSLAEIEVEINCLASKLGAPRTILPTYGQSEDGARPHIETDSRGYHYVVVERGQELSRATTRSVDDLLYLVFSSVTFRLACDYELAHRLPTRDFRRLLFARQIELLSLLSLSWRERMSRHHQEVLEVSPFRDT